MLKLRRIALFTAVLLLMLCGQKAYAEDIEGTFQYPLSIPQGEETERSEEFVYRDSFFTCSSYELNMDLAALALRLSMAGFGTGAESSADNLLAFFDLLNIRYTEETVHYGTPGADTIGFAYGERVTGDNSSVIFVVVRGGNYGPEWASNFTLGSGSNHQGFQTAAARIAITLRDYISTFPKDRELSLLITGYSRGAAVTNLAAYELDNMARGGALGALTVEDIYAFCFECPLTSKKAASSEENTKYNNIFSFVNDFDMVAKVVPGRWGYQRYGVTFFFPSAVNHANFRTLKERMLPYYYRYALTDRYVPADGQTIYLDRALMKLTDLMESPATYEKHLESRVRSAILGENYILDKLSSFIVPRVVSLLDKLNKKPVDAYTLDFATAHEPELCMAWLDSLKDGGELLHCSESYSYFIFNGSADIYVYDRDGRLIASGDGKKMQSYTDEQLGVIYGMNDEFLLAFPKEGRYLITGASTKRNKVDILQGIYHMNASVDEVRYEYNNVLLKKDEGFFFVADSAEPAFYICEKNELQGVFAEYLREGSTKATEKKYSSVHRNEVYPSPVVKLATEIRPEEKPMVTEAPEEPKNVQSEKPKHKVLILLSILLPGIMITGITAVLVRRRVILAARKKAVEEAKPEAEEAVAENQPEAEAAPTSEEG